MKTEYVPGANGIMTVDSRDFYIGGSMVMSENKSNPNNTNLDVLTLYHFDTNNMSLSDVESFRRQADGSLKPDSSQELNEYKKTMIQSLLFFQVVGGSATNRIYSTTVSPDQKLKAIVFSREYGALGSFNRQVVVIENLQPFSNYDPDKVLLSVTADGKASTNLSKVTASWTSSNELHIRYPVGGPKYGPQLVQTNSSDQAIKVTYESFNVQ